MIPLEILKKYWKHDAFRSPQEEIIASVLDGKDTFAVMPTGGGKSITFQVPAMLLDGICIVVSPLVALMKDQVANLQNRGIKAIALTGGISTDEIINLLDNCLYGNYKFLYLSPERLSNNWILERIKALPVSLIAVDEAHCVSQWGHDFRPAYLKIVVLKHHFTKVPFLILTATATSRVKEDIIKQLELNEVELFSKSFERKNLALMIFSTEDKLHVVNQILKKNTQPSIIYVTNRKACTDVVQQLKGLGFTSIHYHGGLSSKEKEKNMSLWMQEQVQVMVATNAFGMGIDKANVKTIIHLNVPQNLENYYQEAGRAGRNGEKAFAILLTNLSDIVHAKSQFLSNLADKQFLNLVFLKICNYFQIAYGEGIYEKHNFNINHFCTKYKLSVTKVYNALQFLDRQGVLSMSQEFSEKVSLQFLLPSKEILRYISLNEAHKEVILAILRTNPGIYESKCVINTFLIANKSNLEEQKVITILQQLHEKNVVDLHLINNDVTLTFNEIREDDKTINRVAKYLETQNSLKTNQLEAVINYIKNDTVCKSKLLLDYFGEKIPNDCGVCSYCISKTKTKIDSNEVIDKVMELLKMQDLNSRDIQKLSKNPKDDIIFTLKTLLENDVIAIKANNLYTLKK